MEMNRKIDAVITWVDGNDDAWIRERNRYAMQSAADRYFRDWGTVKYVLRGIDAFMPWIDKVHFVTWGHTPFWLNKVCRWSKSAAEATPEKHTATRKFY